MKNLVEELFEKLTKNGIKTQGVTKLLDGKSLMVNFSGGYAASCVSHSRSYGGFNKIEIASFKDGNLEYSCPVVDGDVLGYLSVDEAYEKVLEMMEWANKN